MAERERLNVAAGAPDDPSTLHHRISSHVALAYRSDERVTLSNVLYLQPRIDNFSDFRVLNQAAVKMGISGAMSLKIEFTLRYDGEPPTTVEKLDTALSNRLVWDF